MVNGRTVAWILAAACAAGDAGATTTVRIPGAACVPKDGRWTDPTHLWVQAAPGYVADDGLGYAHPWQPIGGGMAYVAGGGVATLVCPVAASTAAAPETATVVYVYGYDASTGYVYQARSCAGSWLGGAPACDAWVTNGAASTTGWLFLQLNPATWRAAGTGGFDYVEVAVPALAGSYAGAIYGYVWGGP